MSRDRLIRLDGSDRILSREECETLARRVFALARGDGETRVRLTSWWEGELRWGRNRVTLASDRRAVSIGISRGNRFEPAHWIVTNQLDDESLEAAVRAAERLRALDTSEYPSPLYAPSVPPIEQPNAAVWSDATYNLTAEGRGAAARSLIDPAEAQGMLSAGYVEVRAGTRIEVSSAARAGEPTHPEVPYQSWTQAQCSMTVRDPAGTGSGWAGLSSYDWGRIDGGELAALALAKCTRSRNPVKLEPGRYTVILEAQAVADIIEAIMGSNQRGPAENQQTAFTLGHDDALGLNRSKLGLRMIDERLTISHDPGDPDLGIVPDWGFAAGPAVYFRNGVLETLPYDHAYAVGALGERSGARWSDSFRMSGGTTSVEEMIRTTKRGLLVTRFDRVRILDQASLLCTGLTRDGLWLIENGQVSKPVSNFRFTESPLFLLNSVEQIGPPARVFRPTEAGDFDHRLTPVVVPPLKARDFSFTSLVDAI